MTEAKVGQKVDVSTLLWEQTLALSVKELEEAMKV